jgi:hypothetical protein
MNDHDYFKNMSIDAIKEVLYKTPTSDITSLCLTDLYIQDICNDETFWKSYAIKANNLSASTVNIWNGRITSYGLTWKELARLYELEILSGYKLKLKEIMDWHKKLTSGLITWEDLYRLFEAGKPIIVINEQRFGYVTIKPEMFLKDVLKRIRKMWSISMETSSMFEISFDHPLGGHITNNVLYNVLDDNVLVLDIVTHGWIEYEQVPIGENCTFELIYEIRVVS